VSPAGELDRKKINDFLGLKSLRNQISVKTSEVTLPIQDSRLQLVTEWLECPTGAYDLFSCIERGSQASY
jgi:hypothetical protein